VEHYAGLDVSLELTSVCIVDTQGRIVRETRVASDPEDLVRHFQSLKLSIERVGLEAGPLSQWIHAGLTAAGFETVLLETRHVKAALSAMTVKTDRHDARGIAQLLRSGWYRPVHAKSVSAQEVRSLLTARKLMQAKLLDVESGIRGLKTASCVSSSRQRRSCANGLKAFRLLKLSSGSQPHWNKLCNRAAKSKICAGGRRLKRREANVRNGSKADLSRQCPRRVVSGH
jgi:transposase